LGTLWSNEIMTVKGIFLAGETYRSQYCCCYPLIICCMMLRKWRRTDAVLG
jgi:hypothetical protein